MLPLILYPFEDVKLFNINQLVPPKRQLSGQFRKYLLLSAKKNEERKMAKIDEARFIILQNGFMSAGACGVFKAFVPIPWLEIGALTWTTRNMCNGIAQIYGYQELSGMDRLIGNIISSATEAKLVSGLLDVVPGFNIGTNAIATFTLQAVSGIILTSICELIDEKTIHRNFVEDISVASINEILVSVTALVGEFSRGNNHKAIESVKEEFCSTALEYQRESLNLMEDCVEAEIQQCVLLATADVADDIVNDIKLLDSKLSEEEIGDYSVADVVGYNDFVKHIYETYLDSLQPNQSLDDIFTAAGKAYRRIYERNCSEGLWSQKKGFDDTLAYYIAGHVKEKTNCIISYSKESLAYELSRYLKDSLY